MLCGYTPFAEDSQEKMFERIKLGSWKFDPEDWSHVSQEAKDLITHLMDTNVDHRYTAAQALKSRWITGLSDKQLSSRNLSSTRHLIKDRKPNWKDIGQLFSAVKINASKAMDTTRKGASSASRSAATVLRVTRGSNHATPNVSGVSSNGSTSHPFV
jgi:serine/threonine protein kinase